MCLQGAPKEPNSDSDQAHQVRIDAEVHVQVALEKKQQKTDTNIDILEADVKDEGPRSVPTPENSKGRKV